MARKDEAAARTAAPDPDAPFPEDGVVLFDRSGREYRVHTRREYSSLVYGQGYSLDKPSDPEPVPEVPQNPVAPTE